MNTSEEELVAIIDKVCKVHDIKSLKDSEFYSRKQQVNKISLIIFNYDTHSYKKANWVEG